ncbi:cytochrome B [Methylosinus sp. R-45379]|uniref:DUF3611 family protein n=1 Tax=unclassified Methylosinus TaxID=2624500 RepID=UPI0004664F1B|nr:MULTISPECIES: DUF3611 family protein [unclassified Methylosinus]OAI30965.1 cytochrome B [Methylosinus sp. R-45379]TDX63528.1 cytochrome b561 [Methylosinus sp. sav-2]
MRSTIARANFLSVVLIGVIVLALGWLAAHSERPLTSPSFALHVALGVLAGALLLAQLVLRFAVPPPALPARWSNGRRATTALCEFLVYLSLALLVATGALWGYFGGAPLEVFGHPLPVSPAADPRLADILGQAWAQPLGLGGATASEALLAAHRLLAYALAGSTALYLALGGFSRFSPQAPPPESTKRAPALIEPSPTSRLSSRLRLFGWLQFWPQLAIALASAVLLQFSTSGRAFSPSQTGYGDAIYWSLFAFLLLCAATALAFFYTRAAPSVAQADYLGVHKLTAFWFLTLGLAIGLIGVIVSFVGLSLSVSLLVAKTVSQPPGIAITDPNKIIRALDVFVLLVNFALLLAHFIGVSIAVFLTSEATRARFRFRIAEPPQESRA